MFMSNYILKKLKVFFLNKVFFCCKSTIYKENRQLRLQNGNFLAYKKNTLFTLKKYKP